MKPVRIKGAAKVPQKQDFAASAEDPMKPAKVRGSKGASESGFLLPPPKTR